MENENQEAEIIVQSTELQLKEFLSGFVWSDMKNELEKWRKDVYDGYEVAQDMHEIGKIRGRIQALSYFMLLPEVLLEGIIDKRLREEEEILTRGGETVPGTDDMA